MERGREKAALAAELRAAMSIVRLRQRQEEDTPRSWPRSALACAASTGDLRRGLPTPICRKRRHSYVESLTQRVPRTFEFTHRHAVIHSKKARAGELTSRSVFAAGANLAIMMGNRSSARAAQSGSVCWT
jgi:hypothetical protein